MDTPPFSPYSVPLQGAQLIEASAGTGKTYTIACLFLRLILERPDMHVRRILVVTFTEAATGELRDRVRTRLSEALGAFRAGGAPAGDAFLQELLRRYAPADAVNRLAGAIADFDEAAIFTIHGFCRNVLRDMAFETGGLFDTEIVTSQDDLVRRAVDDFWRTTINGQSRLFTAFCLRESLNADSLYDLVGSHIGNPGLVIVPQERPVDCAAAEQEFLQALDQSRTLWETGSRDIREFLLHSPDLNRRSYQKRWVEGWLEQLGAWLMDRPPSPQLFDKAGHFTAARLEDAAGDIPPACRPFFEVFTRTRDLAAELEILYRRQVLAIRAAAFEQVRRDLERLKVDQNIQYFDDLLLRVWRALNGPGGRRLAMAVRERFAAAMIDEFQDTDPVQCAIFEAIFNAGDAALFLIGDPKQAIYSFRGADIFTYLQAVAKVDTCHRLGTSWRSGPLLVRAVNTLFGRHDNPFVFEQITFSLAVSGSPEQAPGAPPFELWHVPQSALADLRISQVRRGIAACVANEIVRLASQGEPPGHMAVLVRTHQEAAIVQRELARRRVPCIRQSTQTIFETREAGELELVLRAVAAPGSDARLRPALATLMLGYDALELARLLQDSRVHEAELTGFNALHELWLQQGCFAMLRRLFVERSVLERLIVLPEGERRVTNILHLAEALHRQEAQASPGMNGLVQWLAAQRRGVAPGRDEHQLRLESDEDAVTIVTIHKSKGLEYPIVFCPYAWSGSRPRQQQFLFHDPDNDLRLTLDIGSDRRSGHALIAARETLAENMRLAYVSLTRAKRRCYMVWGNVAGAHASAPAYLLHGAGLDDGDAEAQMKKRLAGLSEQDMRGELEEVARSSAGAIALREVRFDTADARKYGLVAGPQAPLAEPSFSGTISRRWRIASFSSLIEGRPHEQEFPLPDESIAAPALAPDPDTGSIVTLPGGARTGTMLHAVLERADFADPQGPPARSLVADMLVRHGLVDAWGPVVLRLLADVAAAQLQSPYGACRLRDIDRSAQMHELGFYFPLRTLSKKALAGLFHEARQPDFTGALEDLAFQPVAGYMRGFIDLVFFHDGRFHIIDWKSNFLGEQPADYGPEPLARAMRDNFYFLQYHLYTLALHRYLLVRLPGYDYERHFGGVFYVFLRGLSPSAPAQGIFYDRPPPALIQAMDELLIDAGRPG